MIEVNLELGRNAMAIYQDLVTEHKYEHGYASVMRFVRKLRGGQTPEARVPIQSNRPSCGVLREMIVSRQSRVGDDPRRESCPLG